MIRRFSVHSDKEGGQQDGGDGIHIAEHGRGLGRETAHSREEQDIDQARVDDAHHQQQEERGGRGSKTVQMSAQQHIGQHDQGGGAELQRIKLQKTGIKLEREAEGEKRECIRTDTLSLWHKILKDCLFHFCLNPLVGIDKCFYPWSYLIAVFTIGRITTVLPREDRTFQVRAVRGIRSGSDILKKMEDKGEIGIVGAIYHMKTGAVTFL